MSNIEVIYDVYLLHERENAVVIKSDNGQPFSHAVVGVSNPNPNYNVKRDKSIHSVFEYVLEGEGEIVVNGEWVSVKAGSAYVLKAGQYHEYRANPLNPWKKIWINYYADYVLSFMDAYNVTQGVYTNAEGTLPFFEQLCGYIKPGSYSSSLCYEIAECVHKIIENLSMLSVSDNRPEISKIREALQGAVYRKADLDDVSRELHLSKSNLIRIFKKAYGVTPYEYLLSRKIEVAKMLLTSTNMSIKQISDKICMSDEHYFSSLFLKRVGVRPKDYRNAERKGSVKK